jgi:isoquinoline 1-oxidoreductase beta subunit
MSAASMIDSVVFGSLWSQRGIKALFDEIPRTRAWLEIIAVLAEVQAEHALVPASAATAIAACCRTVKVDAAFLAEVGRGREESGHSTQGLIRAIQARLDAADAQWVYANATVVGDGVPLRPDDHGWPARLMRHGQWRFGQLLGVQATGGSTGLRDAWEPVRLAGATARTMLVHAAAARFDVPPKECSTTDGAVHHRPTGRRAGYGELAAIASALPIPHDVTPRARADFRLLGKPRPRLDIPAKVDGSAVFSSDVRLPGQLYAAIVQCPVLGGALRSVETGRARARPGVKAVVELLATSTSAAAVAVVAERFWQAKTAAELLDIAWEPGPAAAYASEAERARQQAALAGAEARVYDEAGEVEHGLAAPARFLDLSYHVPYLAHAAMEPMACTARIDADGCSKNSAPTRATGTRRFWC